VIDCAERVKLEELERDMASDVVVWALAVGEVALLGAMVAAVVRRRAGR
jgi:hypothetical protein